MAPKSMQKSLLQKQQKHGLFHQLDDNDDDDFQESAFPAPHFSQIPRSIYQQKSRSQPPPKPLSCHPHPSKRPKAEPLKGEEGEEESLDSASAAKGNNSPNTLVVDDDDDERCTQLDVLIQLCSSEQHDGIFDDNKNNNNNYDDLSSAIGTHELAHHQPQASSSSNGGDDTFSSRSTNLIDCPLCGADISELSEELRQVHTNGCLDKDSTSVACSNGDTETRCPEKLIDGSSIKFDQPFVDVSPVLQWIHSLGLARYEEIFVKEEIEWDSLKWLTEEDLLRMGITALGPRRKIVTALSELRKESTNTERGSDAHRDLVDGSSRPAVNKLITDYFPGSVGHMKKGGNLSSGRCETKKVNLNTGRKQIVKKRNVISQKLRDIPQWCCIPGTPFRVDAFKYLRRDCSHWFLTHFHVDHYQGLTRSFSHGKVYCSLITAKLVNMKIGIPWDKIQVLPLNKKISIAGIDVTCFDANHCPGSIIVLFEPPNGKAVLHTGDFRFCEEMAKTPVLQTCHIQTLILDTTYCNPKYDFPRQEVVIQFVIEAIQAEVFNPKTLFLIGSYTIGKERLFVEVARVLRKKVYITADKLRVLECLGLTMEDMQWFTLNEHESHIHVVPMWTLASYKRLKCISNQYAHRFSLIVAFSPTGWTFGKGKKPSGRRWQQGTIVR
ncbi:uncharacterized protein LOC127813912 isoform X2 [Diospyros lotus]|nr:uncharacterized protein LOC127813912 isoform X2 [Diospyros lotus]